LNYYNEFDRSAAAWLKELIRNGLIPNGDVDDRDIRDVSIGDLTDYTQCHFFAGIGGWSQALKLAGWPTDRRVWTGSCPCQPFSIAGQRKGEQDKRHLWPEFYRLIAGQSELPVCFGEQVASAAGRVWLSRVRTDLETVGYAVGAADLCAAGVGSPHIRQRLYWVAHPSSSRAMGDSHDGIATFGIETSVRPGPSWERETWGSYASWDMSDARRRAKPGAVRVVDGFPGAVDIIRGYGNAIVPQVAAEFISACLEITQ
jgi:DNA (cytosine-5)-methyltransferase 1